jgi:hypothetical protein
MGLLNWLDGGSFWESKREVERREKVNDKRKASLKTGHPLGCNCHWCKLAETLAEIDRSSKR